MDTINFIGILAMTWLFTTGAGSIEFLKDQVQIGPDSKPKKWWLQLIQEFVNCSMCVGFWIGLAYYQNFLYACIISIAAELFGRVLKLILAKL